MLKFLLTTICVLAVIWAMWAQYWHIRDMMTDGKASQQFMDKLEREIKDALNGR